MSLLLVDKVSVELGGRLALDEATLEINRGERLGLIGPNGAGKTTLIRTILGLQPLVAGTIHFREELAGGEHQVGYVPQRHEFAWDFPISVENVVASGLTGKLGLFRRPKLADWEAVAEALKRVKMWDLRQRTVGELSGGQRQRVLVARALALNPSTLLLDEPFTGLDMPTQELLSELLASLAVEGRAVLMTTHDIAGALYDSDRLVLLNRSVIATGTPAELSEHPQLWMQTFGVTEASPMMRVVEGFAERGARVYS